MGRPRRAGRRRYVTGAKVTFQREAMIGPPACSPKPTTAHSAQIPMPSTIPAIWWGLALLALVAVALVPIGNYFTRRYVAADPWSPT